MSESGLQQILLLLRDLYGRELRKGIYKLAYEHSNDVVHYSFLELVHDSQRALRLVRVGLLHDVVEDFLDLNDLKSRLDLDHEETTLLSILSRNVGHPEGLDYWEGILSSEDALIIKLGDRIANLLDLIEWVRIEEGFNSESLPLYHKYAGEYADLSPLLEDRHPEEKRTGGHPLDFQLPLLQALMDILAALYAVHHMHPTTFASNTEEMFEAFDELVKVINDLRRVRPQTDQEEPGWTVDFLDKNGSLH